jgi:hypothetical protein
MRRGRHLTRAYSTYSTIRDHMKTLLCLLFFSSLSAAALAAPQETLIGKEGCGVVNLHPAENQSITWTGGCRDGYADGDGVLEWLVDGEVREHYQGTLVKGKQEGLGYERRDDGYEYEGGFKNGLREGEGVANLSRGDHYKGSWSRGVPNGLGKMTYATGGSYDGEWKMGRRDGKANVVFAGSEKHVELEYKGNLPAGTPPRPALEQAQYALWGGVPGIPTTRHKVVRSSLPLDKSYAELDDEQKEAFRSFYPMLEDGNEPPYPVNGQEPVFRFLMKAAGKLRTRGFLALDVLVDGEGKAKSVTVIHSPSEDLARLATQMVMEEKYKPAVCSGRPCAMVFPYSVMIK